MDWRSVPFRDPYAIYFYVAVLPLSAIDPTRNPSPQIMARSRRDNNRLYYVDFHSSHQLAWVCLQSMSGACYLRSLSMMSFDRRLVQRITYALLDKQP